MSIDIKYNYEKVNKIIMSSKKWSGSEWVNKNIHIRERKKQVKIETK